MSSSQRTVRADLADVPAGDGLVDDVSPSEASDPDRSHLVADLSRSISVAPLTSDEVAELQRFASHVHHRLAILRGVFPEPPALQSSSWLTTRAYIASRLEHLLFDPSVSVAVSLPSSSSQMPP